MSSIRTKLMLAGTIATLGAGSLGTVAVAQARNGADDPAAHNAGDHHGGPRAGASKHDAGDDRRGHRVHAHAARHARDDRPGDDRGGKGRDDGPGDDHGAR